MRCSCRRGGAWKFEEFEEKAECLMLSPETVGEELNVGLRPLAPIFYTESSGGPVHACPTLLLLFCY